MRTATGKTTLPIRVTGASCVSARTRRGTYIKANWTNRRYGDNSTLTRRIGDDAGDGSRRAPGTALSEPAEKRTLRQRPRKLSDVLSGRQGAALIDGGCARTKRSDVATSL